MMTVIGVDDELVAVLRLLNRSRRGPAGSDAIEAADARLSALDRLLRAHEEHGPREESSPSFAEVAGLLESAADRRSDAAHPGGPRAAGADALSDALTDLLDPILDELIEAVLDRPANRLAAYGSLVPGAANHHLLADLDGRWETGSVRGTLHETGWGAGLGYPGLVWNPDESPVPLQVFHSTELGRSWPDIDAFEGDSYRRILVPVETESGVRVSNLYTVEPG